MLSELRHGQERSNKIYQELGQAAQNPEIKEALDARAMISSQVISRLDECFRIIGEKPVPVNQRLHDLFVDDFRRELSEIQSPLARKLFVLSKAASLVHLQVGSYIAMIAAADTFGRPAVGMLLESCLADKLAFVERTKRMIREYIEQKAAGRLEAKTSPELPKETSGIRANFDSVVSQELNSRPLFFRLSIPPRQLMLLRCTNRAEEAGLCARARSDQLVPDLDDFASAPSLRAGGNCALGNQR